MPVDKQRMAGVIKWRNKDVPERFQATGADDMKARLQEAAASLVEEALKSDDGTASLTLSVRTAKAKKAAAED